MRFLAEANLSRIVRCAKRHVDAGEVRAHPNDRIPEVFDGDVFEMAAFPGYAQSSGTDMKRAGRPGSDRGRAAVIASRR